MRISLTTVPRIRIYLKAVSKCLKPRTKTYLEGLQLETNLCEIDSQFFQCQMCIHLEKLDEQEDVFDGYESI